MVLQHSSVTFMNLRCHSNAKVGIFTELCCNTVMISFSQETATALFSVAILEYIGQCLANQGVCSMQY